MASFGFMRFVLLLGLLVACGDDMPPPSGCDFPTMFGPDDREVVIGSLRSGPEPIAERFTEWVDGENQPLVFGFQGGYMVVPTVRITAMPDDPDGLCASVLIENESDVGRVERGMEVARELIPLDGHLWAGPFDNLLAFELEDVENHEVTVSITVGTERFQSSDTASFTAVLE